MTNHVTRCLAEFVADSQWQDIPDKVRHEAKRAVLNFVGTALGGCRDEAAVLAIRALRPFFGPPQATVIGRSE
jgi:2-methylcitrate dehydratase PrpD